MSKTNIYPAVSEVYPTNENGRLRLFSTQEAAETYAKERNAVLLFPEPVLTQKTLWNRVVLRFRGDSYEWDAYTVEEFINPSKVRPGTASRPSVRRISDPYSVIPNPKDYIPCTQKGERPVCNDTVPSRKDVMFEMCAESDEKARELAGFLGDSVLGWVKKEGKQKPSLSHRLELALKNHVEEYLA